MILFYEELTSCRIFVRRTSSVSVSLDWQNSQGSVPTAPYDVVVVGAGPYGLSTAAHLNAQGVKLAIFGKPLGFWLDAMPRDMLLHSYWWATTLSDPEKR
jgi:alkyl hydroperoxide reductase subunit AhpF